MKTWNWQWILRVVLILLIACLITSIVIEATTLELYGNGQFWCRVQVKDRAYSLDNVTAKLSFGLYDITDHPRESRTSIRGYDSLVCVALYFCPSDDYKTFKKDVEIEDYTNLEGNHFIKAIPAEDAFSGYGIYKELFSTKYQHSEKLTIPREILEEYDGSFCIKIITIHSKDGKQYISGHRECVYIGYQITDEETVEFYSIGREQ